MKWMSFPREATEQLRRRILENCQDHIRKVVDDFREVYMAIVAFQNGEENQILQHHSKVAKLSEESDEIKGTILREIAEVGAMLNSREDFFRLSSEVGKIAGFCSGVSYRLAELAKRKLKTNKDLLKDLGSLAEASLDCVMRLRETIMALTYGGDKVIELGKKVEVAERTVDNIYRKVDMNIISSNMKLPQLFLFREIAIFLEDIADVCENANDIAEILAITT
jgi:uncharacterized protein Yka (UPF0111/DUF47 family)